MSYWSVVLCVCLALVSELKWSESCSVVSDSLRPRGLYSPWSSPGQNTGVGSLSLPQGIFPTQGSNLGLPHCRRKLTVNPMTGQFPRNTGQTSTYSPSASWGQNPSVEGKTPQILAIQMLQSESQWATGWPGAYYLTLQRLHTWASKHAEEVNRTKSYLAQSRHLNKAGFGDFSGSPVVKTLPSNAAGMGLIPSQGAKNSHAS